MSLASGTRLGPYQVTALIGQGGMGQVWRATDTNLARQVALKVLPDAFLQDADRLARFEREAKTLAALNHPNIAAIYGLEQAGGSSALVMELVEGPTLADRIAMGPIPVAEVLPIAIQIAEALEAAHGRGIIHRDLKPANVKLRDDGVVKVLDFGLAKALDPIGSATAGDLADSPTITSPALTVQGVILGTAAYMSPEQARGKPVDKRSDVWAFGVVLYEMLTGTRAFAGNDVSEMLASVLAREPEWGRLPGSLSPTLVRFVKRCLDKNPKQRIADMQDVRLALEGAFEVGTATATVAVVRWRHVALAGALALVTVVSLVGWWRATRPTEQAPQSLMRLDLDLGPDVALGGPATGPNAILSPDGTKLAYVSQSRLFLRRLDQAKPIELEGTAEATGPFFSPDGEWIGFVAARRLKKVAVGGGSPTTLRDLREAVRGASWGADGNIVAALSPASGLAIIPAAGGAPIPFTELAPGEVTHRWPQVLPGAKAVLFTAHRAIIGFDEATIEVMSLTDRRRTRLVQGTFGRYLDSGHLIYVRGGTLFAVRFDLNRLTTTGSPWPVLEVSADPVSGSAQFDVSRTGAFVYRAGDPGTLVTVQWLDALGRMQPLVATPGVYQRPRLSPDGQKVALVISKGAGADIVVYDPQRDTTTPLTFGGGSFDGPMWSVDGRYVLFLGPGGMWWNRADGAGKPQSLTKSASPRQFPYSFPLDGKRLAFFESGPGSIPDLWTVPMQSDESGLRPGTPEVFLSGPGNDERHPAFSPDGRWLAYSSNETGEFDVYVRPFPNTGGQWRISTGGAMYPLWSRNGRALFFRALDNRIMVASYTVAGNSFVADKPRVWSDKQRGNSGVVLHYDLAPDGARIATIVPVESPTNQWRQSHVTFLLNFFDEVRRRGM